MLVVLRQSSMTFLPLTQFTGMLVGREHASFISLPDSDSLAPKSVDFDMPNKSLLTPELVARRYGKKKYSPDQIRQWSYSLRQIANSLCDRGSVVISGHFYNVHYAIGPDPPETDEDPLEFDPFCLDQEYLSLPESGGIEGQLKSLRFVAGKNHEYIDPELWGSGLGGYLNELIRILKRSKKNTPPKEKAKMVLHHDDPPCEAILKDYFCPVCKFLPDMQSTCFHCHCSKCGVALKNMKCPICKKEFIKE